MRTDSSAAMRKVSISRVTSPSASLIGLPGLDAQREGQLVEALLEAVDAMLEHACRS